jgi:hypothetical protein
VFVLIGLAIRRSQVPEIRIAVTANDKPLGDPMTLRRKESFNIANGYFEGRSVSARGLNCKVAAKVRYMGRRKFEIEAVEAKIIDEGRELERMKIGMDTFFDLKDNDGKVLHLITISKPGRESDPFGGSDGRDPF